MNTALRLWAAYRARMNNDSAAVETDVVTALFLLVVCGIAAGVFGE